MWIRMKEKEVEKDPTERQEQHSLKQHLWAEEGEKRWRGEEEEV